MPGRAAGLASLAKDRGGIFGAVATGRGTSREQADPEHAGRGPGGLGLSTGAAATPPSGIVGRESCSPQPARAGAWGSVKAARASKRARARRLVGRPVDSRAFIPPRDLAR